MQENDNIENEFNDLPEELKRLKGSQDFELPTGYFNQMQVNVQEKISEEKSFMAKHWVKLAGLSVSAVFVAVFVWEASLTNPTLEIEGDDYYAFVEDQIDDYSVEAIAEEMEEEEVELIMEEEVAQVVPTDSSKTNNIVVPQDTAEVELELTDDEVIDYLIEEGYDGWEL